MSYLESKPYKQGGREDEGEREDGCENVLVNQKVEHSVNRSVGLQVIK